MAEPVHDLGQAGRRRRSAQQVVGRHQVTRLDAAALGELGQQAAQVRVAERGAEGLGGRPAQQVIEHLLLPALLADLELDLAAQRADDGGQVADPGHRLLARRVIAARRTAEARARASAAAIANRADTPDRASTAGEARTSRVNLAITWIRCSGSTAPGSWPSQAISASWRISASSASSDTRVVGADLGAEPVLERRDDPAPVGVVLRVGAGHEDQVERQPQRVAADADVALLEHVEQRHLDPLGQVGQLVQAEDAPVGPRHQAEVDGLRVAEGPALGHLDRVDVADQVADAGVRGGQLLAVPVARGAAR